jgi:hypothetical protein
MRVRAWICRVLLLIAATVGVAGAERRPLPAFTVTSPAGNGVTSAALSSEERWVLIYVSPDCRSCDRLLASLKEWQSPQLTSRTVVIVRGPAAAAAAYVAARLPAEVAAIAWYADERSEAWQALSLKGTPVLIAVERGEIDWTIAGVLNDPKALEPVVRRWVEY